MQYLADAANFSTFFSGSPAAKSTPHLYISALSTWNQQSPVWTHWKDQFPFTPLISLKCAITVPLLTMTTDHEISCIALSGNGDIIVSSFVGRCCHSVLWDAKKGKQLRELQGHTDCVFSVAFSPDGNQIVSGSFDQSPHMNSSLDSSCIVGPDGWILSDDKHLIWIPSTIRNVLYYPYNTLIISRSGSATISFENSKLGHLWHECYTH
jgi:WD40 repeat protein